jgi:hypothetical protein
MVMNRVNKPSNGFKSYEKDMTKRTDGNALPQSLGVITGKVAIMNS